MLALPATLLLALAATAHAGPTYATPLTPSTSCGGGTNWTDVACPSDTSTCCPYEWSTSTYGCVPIPNAVCCSNGYTACPAGTTCSDSGSSWAVVTKCMKDTSEVQVGEQICKIGPQLPLSTTLPNILILGDSVSIGYEPFVAEYMAAEALVQHTPWSGDGGSCETAYTLECLDFFLTSPSGEDLDHVDILYFNSGLHNLLTSGTGVPGQSGNMTVYKAELAQITARLQSWAKPRGTKLLFALTSAFLCSKETDDIVVQLNTWAAEVMKDAGIPTINLHDAIVGKCGQAPVSPPCFGINNCFCPHCPGTASNPGGYPWLANTTIIPALRKMLNE